MSKYKFICENEELGHKVTVESEAVLITDLVEAFKEFLAGCGFHHENIQELFPESP